MSFRTDRFFYLNPDKTRALYGQLFGKVPTISVTHRDVGGGAVITASFGADAEAGVEARRSTETHSEVTADALAVAIIDKLGKSRDYFPDSKFKQLVDRMLRGGTSAIATVEGRFCVDRSTTDEEWLNKLSHSDYVTLHLDENDRRVQRLKSRNSKATGLWCAMNTEYIVESHHPSGHIGQVLRGSRSLHLAVTGWVEPNGYINPLVVFW